MNTIGQALNVDIASKKILLSLKKKNPNELAIPMLSWNANA